MLSLEEMDNEFSCLKDGVLKASITESTVMRNLHSAMNRAQEKVKSREGVFERLSESSKFLELAIMQLDGCLGFVEEETDSESILEGNHEKVLTDLTVVRDRLQGRLEETELAISKMDGELIEKSELEFKLRQALDEKDRELESVRFTLDLEKAKNRGIQGMHERRDGGFSELKNSLDRQFWDIKQKLKSISKMSTGPPSSTIMEPRLEFLDTRKNEGFQNIGTDSPNEKDTPSLMSEIKMEMEQIGSDIDILKDKLDLDFVRLHNAIYLSELGPLETQWRRAVENDTMAISLKGFIGELSWKATETGMCDRRNISCICGFLSENWQDLVDEIMILRRELESFSSENGVLMRANSVEASSSEERNSHQTKEQASLQEGIASSRQLENVPELSGDDGTEGDRSRLVLKLIRNHESIIQRKREELNRLKGEMCEKKAFSLHQKNKEIGQLRRRINEVIFRFDNIMRWNTSLIRTTTTVDVYRSENEMRTDHVQVLTESDTNEEKKIVADDSAAFRNLTGALQHEIENLKQENEDQHLQSMIFEETYFIVFAGLMKELYIELHGYDIENVIREGVSKELFNGWVEENIETINMINIESNIREDVFYVALLQTMKGMNDAHNSSIEEVKNRNEHLHHSNSSNSIDDTRMGEGPTESLIEKLDFFLQTYEELDENLMASPNPELKNFGLADKYVFDQYDWKEVQNEDDNDIFCSVSSKLEKSMQQLVLSRALLSEMGSDIDPASSGLDLVRDQSVEQTRDASSSLATENTVVQQNIQLLHDRGVEQTRDTYSSLATEDTVVQPQSTDKSVFLPLAEFPQALVDFQRAMDVELARNNTRLEEVKSALDKLVGVVASIAKRECAYRKAFFRRCENLQKAETEVDLLGDQVDGLLDLLEKIYMTLNHYAPTLQEHLGVSEILKSIEKELIGEGAPS